MIVFVVFLSAKSSLDVNKEFSFSDGTVGVPKAKYLGNTELVHNCLLCGENVDHFNVDLHRVKKFLSGIYHSVKKIASDLLHTSRHALFRTSGGVVRLF